MQHVSSWFQAALLPYRWSVAGIPCYALSVWHVWALSELRNPYLCGGPIDRDAAAGLLLVAMGDYRHGRRMWLDGAYRDRCLRRVSRVLARREWRDVDAAVQDFVGCCTRSPGHVRRVDNGKEGRTCAAPAAWMLVDFLAGSDPARMADAWDTPYCVARCMFDAHRDLRGEDDSLETPEQEARYDRIEAEKRAQ